MTDTDKTKLENHGLLEEFRSLTNGKGHGNRPEDGAGIPPQRLAHGGRMLVSVGTRDGRGNGRWL